MRAAREGLGERVSGCARSAATKHATPAFVPIFGPRAGWCGVRSRQSFVMMSARADTGSANNNNTSSAQSERASYTVAESRPLPGRDFYGIPNPPRGTPLLLSDLRERLIRQEETIIFALIERAQFRLNDIIYKVGAFELPRGARTFSEYLLHELECVYAKVRRYTSPDEHPFAKCLPQPILKQLEYPRTLCANDINVNDRIMQVYVTELLPRICEHGDDQNYGSSAAADVACLQALSKRIHYGKFIAEAKVQEEPEVYKKLALNLDEDGIWNALQNERVEELLLRRVSNKARSYGSDVTDFGVRDVYKVQPETIAQMYKDFIIPLTMHVEVAYVLQRFGQLAQTLKEKRSSVEDDKDAGQGNIQSEQNGL